MIRPWMVTLALRLLDEEQKDADEERRALEELSDEDLVDAARGAPIEVGDFVDRLAPGGPADLGSPLVVQRDANSGDPPNSTLFVASTDTPDRSMDVIRQDWRLKGFRDNPVILDNHNPMRVVGRGLSATVPKVGDDAGKLMIRVGWKMDSPDPTLAAVGHDHLNGYRRAGSVGFVSADKTARDKLPTDHPAYQEPVEVEAWWGGKVKMAGIYFQKNDLREFSSATIPANPEALQRSLVAEMAGLDPADVARRAGLRFPPGLARALVDQLQADAAPETRAALLEILWPDVVQRLRSDVEVRRVIGALVAATPPAPPVPVPTVAELTLRLLKEES